MFKYVLYFLHNILITESWYLPDSWDSSPLSRCWTVIHCMEASVAGAELLYTPSVRLKRYNRGDK